MGGRSHQGGSVSPSSTTTITAGRAAPEVEDEMRRQHQQQQQAAASSTGKSKAHAAAGDGREDSIPSYYQTQQRSPRVIIWHAWTWFAGTFPLSMLETWELALLAVFFGGLTFLIWYSLFFHFPDHVRQMIAKGTYYLYGKLSHPSAAASSAASAVSNGESLAAVSHGIDRAADVLIGQQRKRLTGEL